MIFQITRISLRSCSNKIANVKPVISCTSNVSNHYEQKRSISCLQSRNFRDRSIKKPAPWPYKEKKYTFLHAVFDNTMSRFDDNTRLIVIDGNIGSGKTQLAKKLAEEFEMKYFPEVSVDSIYVTESGFDVRSLDNHMPEACKSFDLKKFYENPKSPRVAFFQHMMYGLRYEQYIDALAHLLNTGEGVVLERSVYSDFVFMETMWKMGYMSTPAKNWYYSVKKNSILDLLQPHLVIYLDVPVDTCLQRIQKRNLPHEMNSKVLTKEYLQEIERQYKQHFLKEISLHSEVLIFDWKNFGDIDAVIDDIEKVDFDNYDKYDLKLRDWRHNDKWEWNNLRRMFTNEKLELFNQLEIPDLNVPEIYMSGNDAEEMENVLRQVPELRYSKGFNKFLGDTNVLFKTKSNYWDEQKLRYY